MFKTTSFVDDLNLMSDDRKQLQRALDVLAEFMHDTSQQVNEKKTEAFKLKRRPDVGNVQSHVRDRSTRLVHRI